MNKSFTTLNTSLILKNIFTSKHRNTLTISLALFFFYACNNIKEGSTIEEKDEFIQNIRTTDARTPANEKKGFKLPKGFKIELFASEPEIGKPINISFDAKGRLWVSQSYEYPFADSTGVGKDKISILEDSNGDGKADIIKTFADSLNIPIGILPVKNGAIAYNIPNVYHLVDNNGDDKVDERKVILSGFGYDDTHGMINNFFRGLDGWIHGSHGFANDSKVTDRNGKSIEMHSGNTFRFKEDGSDLEFTTTGRVNPFGYAYDEMGYLYSVDCHTSPIYQLIRGADYPHFGKKPTGIGFGPSSEIENEHGATALAGLEYYIATHFPEKYQNSFYYGDPVQCKVYRSTKNMKGTTPYITQEDDFIISEDPWFRPVDVKMGPDGALYIADFYNRIIGHYEVPLDHPGRDRERGRIWKITYVGDEKHDDLSKTDWGTTNLNELIKGLGQENLPLRTKISDQIINRYGAKATKPLQKILATSSHSGQKTQILWLLYRLNTLSENTLSAIFKDDNTTLQLHALRIMFEYKELSNSLIDIARKQLKKKKPDLARAAIMVLSKKPTLNQLFEILEYQKSIPHSDTHLNYVARQSLRDHLRNDAVFKTLLSKKLNLEQQTLLLDLARGVDSEYAANFYLSYMKSLPKLKEKELLQIVAHTARFIPLNQLSELVFISKKLSINDLDVQFNTYKKIIDGLERRAAKENSATIKWAKDLATKFLNQHKDFSEQWRIIPLEKGMYDDVPWFITELGTSNKSNPIKALESESREMGIIESPEFTISKNIRFQLHGSKRNSKALTPSMNRIQLVLSNSNEIIQEAFVDSPNFKKDISWNNLKHKGKKGFLRLIDGIDSRGEFIGISQLNPEVVKLPKLSPEILSERLVFSAEIIGKYQLNSFTSEMKQLLLSEKAEFKVKAACASALIKLDKNNVTLIGEQISNEQLSIHLKKSFIESIGKVSNNESIAILRQSLNNSPYTFQKEVAMLLTESINGITNLFDAIDKLEVAPRILLEREIHMNLQNNGSKNQLELFARKTKGIKKPSEAIQELINDRIDDFQPLNESINSGHEVFVSNCSSCHQIKGKGAAIGPQLDGIGAWGIQALTEKILDPNRNISKAFVNYSIKQKDGSTKNGLLRREEGEVLIFANNTGEEFSIPKSDILEKKATPFTLMPDHFGEVLSEEDFYSLINFLLTEN